MAGLRVIAHMGNIPARIFCIIRGGFLAMIVTGLICPEAVFSGADIGPAFFLSFHQFDHAARNVTGG
jgi:hypothetical protein